MNPPRTGDPARGGSSGWLTGLTILLSAIAYAAPARAQSPAPCELGTCAVLGLTALTVGTGSVVAYARHKGGVSTMREGLTVWSIGFGVTAVAGIALGGDKGRQNRVASASVLAAVAGGVAGIAIHALGVGNDDSGGLAAALIGAASGVLVGGVYGALSYESDADLAGVQASRFPSMIAFRLAF